MCRITAVDVGMCLPKCFVIIVNLFTFLLGSLIFGACIAAMIFVEENIGTGKINFLFYGPIAFGGIIVFISFFGCCGACFKNRCMLMTFAILLFIIFACQCGIVYFVYDLYVQFNKAVNKALMDTIASTKDNEILFYIWAFVQNIFNCCGVNSLTDWQIVSENLPMSCCPMQNMTMRNETEVPETSQNATCTESNAFETGCEKRVTNYLDVWFHPVTVGVIVILSIQLINLILSCCMFFVYGWTQRKEKRRITAATYVFKDKSPQRIHDQFIVNKDRF